MLGNHIDGKRVDRPLKLVRKGNATMGDAQSNFMPFLTSIFLSTDRYALDRDPVSDRAFQKQFLVLSQ